MKKISSVLDNLSNDELKKIAARIIYLRNDILHMTQSEFASALNISQTYLSLIENGKKAVKKPMIDNILVTFKVNIEWLIYGYGSDNDIFLEAATTRDYLMKSSQEMVLSDLQRLYQLKPNEIGFLRWFLSLPACERAKYLSSLENLSVITNSYPPGAL